MGISKKILFLSIVGILLLVIGMSSFLSKIHISNIDSNVAVNQKGLKEEYIKTLSGDNKKEVNYLLFNPTTHQKAINLFLDAKIHTIKISRIEFFQDDKFVTDKIDFKSERVNDNLITVILLEYVEKFNIARVYTESGQQFDVNIGQFYIDKLDVKNNIDNKRVLKLDSFFTKENNNTFELDSKYVIEEQNEYKIETYFNKNLKDLSIIKQDLLLENNNLKFNCNIPEEYFKNNNLLDISFDIAFIQRDADNDEYNIVEFYVPLSIRDSDKK